MKYCFSDVSSMIKSINSKQRKNQIWS